MKKKIITLCLVIALLSVAVIGGTLAYFTDVDQATNEFTVGNVDIDLYETVGHKDAVNNDKSDKIKVDGEAGKTAEQLTDLGKGDDVGFTVTYGPAMPGDVLTKTVTVENPGSEPAYVALAIQQNNYGIGGLKDDAARVASKDFNYRIDTYYENTKNSYRDLIRAEYMQEAVTKAYDGAKMQALISGIFTGSGWNKLSYTKIVNGEAKDAGALAPNSDMRYYPTLVGARDQSEAADKPYNGNQPQLIAVDYSVARQGKHGGNILDATVYNKCENGTRIWVYYIYLPAKNIDAETGKNLSSYTLDLEITIPALEIDEYSIAAFDGMQLDVRASAIQTSGFETARDAFKALEQVYDYNYTCYIGCTENHEED